MAFASTGCPTWHRPSRPAGSSRVRHRGPRRLAHHRSGRRCARHVGPHRPSWPGRRRPLPHRGGPGAGRPGAPAPGHHRPQHGGQPAVRQGRHRPRLQRRALQLQAAPGRAREPRGALPHRVGHRGRARGVALRRRGLAAPLPRHVRARPAGAGHRPPGAGPGPLRDQAAVRGRARQGCGLRQRAQGAADGAGRRRGGPHGHRRVAALLLGAGEPLRHQRRGEAARRVLGREAARAADAGAPLLRPRRGARPPGPGHRSRGADGDPGGLRLRAPDRRRARLHLPVRRAGLEPGDRPGPP